MTFYLTFSIILGYFALNYVWPRIVFSKFLANKTIAYKLFFCLCSMFLITNFLVLALGLLNLLNWVPIFIFFYGILLISITWKFIKLKFDFTELIKLFKISTIDRLIQFKNHFLRKNIRNKTFWINFACYLIISLVIIAISINIIILASNWNSQFVFNDTNIHTSWIQALKEGQIFKDGIYPYAMHCNIYTMNILFAVPIDFSWRVLSGINCALFLISLLWFLKTIFKRPISICFVYIMLFVFAFILFNTNIKSANTAESMYRFLWCLPEEYSLWCIFVAATALMKIFKLPIKNKEKLSKNNKLLPWFIMLSLSVGCAFATHFYSLFILVIICTVIFVCNLNKLNLTKIKYIICSGLIPVLICIIPFCAALTLNYNLSDSIKWGSLQIINEEMDNRDLEELKAMREKYNIQRPTLLDATTTNEQGETISLLDNAVNIGFSKLCPNNTTWLFITFSAIAFIAYILSLFLNKKSFQKYSVLFFESAVIFVLYLLNLYEIWNIIECNRLIPILYAMLFSFMAISLDFILSKPWKMN